MRGWGHRGAGLTFIKIGHGRLALLLVLLLSVSIEVIVRLHVVPGVVLKDVVILVQESLAELEGIASLLVGLGIVR